MIDILLTLLIPFTYLTLLMDTFKYPGFVGNHFLIDSRVYLAVTVVALSFSLIRTRVLRNILNLNLIVMPIIVLAFVWFSEIEATNYINYVLSKFHLSLNGLVYLLLFSLLIFAISGLKATGLNINKSRNVVYKVLIISLIASSFVINMYAIGKDAAVTDSYVFSHLKSSYDEKMFSQWGDFYNLMTFVKNNTPSDSTIIIPPQISPWLSTGNLSLVRYFLYPRNLFQYQTEEIPDIKSFPAGTYILISQGEWGCEGLGCKEWPVQQIKAEKVVYKEPNSVNVKEIRQNFLYNPNGTGNPFGLLDL